MEGGKSLIRLVNTNRGRMNRPLLIPNYKHWNHLNTQIVIEIDLLNLNHFPTNISCSRFIVIESGASIISRS